MAQEADQFGLRPTAHASDNAVPTARLVEDLNRVNRHFHNHRNCGGSERKRSPQRVIRLDGRKKPDNIAYDFRNDWRDFRDGWKLLEGAEQ